MDYMSGLPTTKHGNGCVFVVVDRFSKMAILTACKKTITVEATAKLFFEWVWIHFGLPQQLFPTRIAGSLAHFGLAYGHCWIQSSPNPPPSIPKRMAKRK